MDTEDKTTSNLADQTPVKRGRPAGTLSPTTVKNSLYTDKLREEYHDPVVTVLCMTLPDGDARQLPWDKEKADTLVKLAKFFHHVRSPIKTDGSDSEKKSVSFAVYMPNPSDVPVIKSINGQSEEVTND